MTQSAALLEVDGIAMHFGGAAVLDSLSLKLAKGDLCCIIGPNGCGKTTLFNIITGAFRPTAGTIRLAGTDITGWPPHKIARLGLTRKFQVPGVYPDLSVTENLEIAIAASTQTAALRLATLVPAPEERERMLELCRLSAKAEDKVATLAHGEKQWLEIAMLVATGAGIVLLDEPTAGMSVVETSQTAELIRRLQEDLGRTVLVIEHDMRFVQQLECRVAVMLRGIVLREGTYDEVRADQRVIKAYLGESESAC